MISYCLNFNEEADISMTFDQFLQNFTIPQFQVIISIKSVHFINMVNLKIDRRNAKKHPAGVVDI